MKKVFYILSFLVAVASCTDKESFIENDSTDVVDAVEKGEIIQIGGVETLGLDLSVSSVSTRAGVQNAEAVPWLVQPLKDGLDITYGKVINGTGDDKRKVAILKLKPGTGSGSYEIDPVTNWAIYSFTYRDGGANAIWYDNGAHFFEGVYVPDAIRYGSAYTESGRQDLASVNNTSAPNILTDQSKEGDTDNYTLLSRYLGMPANTHISATLGRIKLPFRHRLARVQAYVLIDPEMNGVTLKGFSLNANGKDDPKTTSISFNNVEVLSGVADTKNNDGTHVLTPHWDKPRKVTPHFVGMCGSLDGSGNALDEQFIMYYNDAKLSYVFPTDKEWAGYHNMTDDQLRANKITKTVYGVEYEGGVLKNNKVPVYDLIVRPTYTSVDSVMYDEDMTNITKEQLKDKKNAIEFELTLSNGLIYTKKFEFDLDANYQTVVYLRIGREQVDYNASGSALWVNSEYNDDWYGIDNAGNHSLSKAGSSWQRAYTYNSTLSNDKVTDGGYYNESTLDEDGTDGQYLTNASTWIRKFAQAYEGGNHHGDYFILTNDIEIDASLLPENFVFTGHLDAQGHKITLKNAGSYSRTEYRQTTDYSKTPLYTSEVGGEVFVLPDLYKKNEQEEYILQNDPIPSLSDVVNSTEYYQKISDGNYNLYSLSDVTFYETIEHTNASSLFTGLNGAYAAQRGEANVHLEREVLVPYVDATTGTGWRAEVMNLIVDGKLFPDEVYTYSTDVTPVKNGYVISKVSGNVQNCSDSQGKVLNHTPALFKY